jgi:cytochrome c-type biogenesis protein CcmF
MGVLTVMGQMVFWQRHSWVSLGTSLLLPTIATTVITAISAIMGQVNDLYSITFFWVGWFTVIGNAWVMGSLLVKKPALIGGTVTHIGFGVLLIGVLASSKFSTFLVPPVTESFNARVAAGEAYDEDGFPITTQIESFELQRNQPKVVNQQYMVTYEGYELKDTPRPGTQVYTLTFQPLDGRESFTLSPEVYPMSSTAQTDRVDWSVDPDILTGWMSDIYLFVGGSALVERRNEQIAAQATMNEAAMSRTISDQGSGASSSGAQAATTDSIAVVSLLPNDPVQAGPYQFTFSGYEPAQEDEVPDNTQVAIRANIQVTHMPTGRSYEVVPLFAVFIDEGENFTYSPSLRIEEWGLDVQFSSIVPNDESIEITVAGLNEFIEEDWIYLTVEKKPFVSAVWLGTFLLMGGFSISIFRHWARDRNAKKAKQTKKQPGDSPQPSVA